MAKEIRLHGRGGQGALRASAILCHAFVGEGKYASSFAMFGAEPRGAPMAAFLRFGDRILREKTQVYYPDCLVVIDPSQAESAPVYHGLKPDGILVLNSPHQLDRLPHPNLKVTGTLDATQVALDEIGRPITNGPMLGAFARTTGWVGLDSVLAALKQYFRGDPLMKNIRCVERGFEEVKVTRW